MILISHCVARVWAIPSVARGVGHPERLPSCGPPGASPARQNGAFNIKTLMLKEVCRCAVVNYTDEDFQKSSYKGVNEFLSTSGRQVVLT